jgi:hypothetical protein
MRPDWTAGSLCVDQQGLVSISGDSSLHFSLFQSTGKFGGRMNDGSVSNRNPVECGWNRLIRPEEDCFKERVSKNMTKKNKKQLIN